MTDTLLVTTTPVFEVDAQVRGDLSRDVVRLEVEEDTQGLKTLYARFLATGPIEAGRDEGLLYLDGEIFDFGRSIAVSIGPADASRTIFRGAVSGIEANFAEGQAPEVVVYAEDRLMDLRMTRRTKTYEEMTDAEIAEEIAGEHGMSVDVAAAGPTYDRIQQLNLSDLAFLRERARLIRAEVWVANDTLCFKTRGERTGPEFTLVQGNDLVALTVTADLAHQRTSVRVTGFDAAEREPIDEEAGADVVHAEAPVGRTGSSVLSSAFGARVMHHALEVPLVGEEAAAWADAEMLRRARSFVLARGVTTGTPDMIVGSRLTLERVGAPFNGGGYYVTRVRQLYDLGCAHRTQFVAERTTIEAGE